MINLGKKSLVKTQIKGIIAMCDTLTEMYDVVVTFSKLSKSILFLNIEDFYEFLTGYEVDVTHENESIHHTVTIDGIRYSHVELKEQ